RAEAVAASITRCGGTAASMHVDVTSPELVQHLVAETVSGFGRLDALYHCAADVQFVNTKDNRLTELDDEVWRRIIDVHLTGTFFPVDAGYMAFKAQVDVMGTMQAAY